MSDPHHTLYQSIRGGHVRDTLSGAALSPAPDEAGVWLIETGPGFAPPGFSPRAGDRFRDAAGKWWAVKDVGTADAAGVCRLTCHRETP